MMSEGGSDEEMPAKKGHQSLRND